MRRIPWVIGGTAALLAAITLAAAGRLSSDIEVGSPAWRRLVRGPTLDGILYPGARAVIALPDLPRQRPREIVFTATPLAEGTTTLAVGIDGSAPVFLAVTDRGPARVTLPPSGHAGARLDLEVLRGTPGLRLQALGVIGAWPAVGPLLIMALVAAALTVAAARLEAIPIPGAVALGACAAGLAALGTTFLTGGAALGRAAPAHTLGVAVLASGLVAGLVARPAARAGFLRALLLVAAFGSGALVRWYFLPSPGSWDMDYWRAWTGRALAAGTTGVYGPPVEDGHFLPQLRGQEPLWRIEHQGRSFTVDYPPLALFTWRTAARLVGPAESDPTGWAIALKLPAVIGDVLAVVVLALTGSRRREAVRWAALYWILPASWLSSAVLGYLDGAYAPLVLIAALAAGTARPGVAGAALAVAALVKPTALVAAPAIAVALRSRTALARGTAAGVAVVAAALVPFALAGTLGAAVTHVSRIVVQERLSGGYANIWWAVGALLSRSGTGEVPYVRLADTAVPVRVLSLLAFVASAVVVGRALARVPGPRATVAAAAALFAAYGVLAVGVHVNHPHPMVLLLVAAGMGGRPWRGAAWTLVIAYTANIVLLEGLGRLTGVRYGPLESAGVAAETVRMALGFDVTLLLALANAVALGVILARARAGLEAAEEV